MLYSNIEGESAWTEEEVYEAYEEELASHPDTTGTFEEWIEKLRDLGLVTVDIGDYLDQILDG